MRSFSVIDPVFNLTPDRTTESLFEELVVNGIIVKYPEFYMRQFIGDRAYSARPSTNPALGDVRQVLKEYCILPLGSAIIRNFAPCIKSILIAGPKGEELEIQRKSAFYTDRKNLNFESF